MQGFINCCNGAPRLARRQSIYKIIPAPAFCTHQKPATAASRQLQAAGRARMPTTTACRMCGKTARGILRCRRHTTTG